jgi:hypothetical protein
MGAALIGTTTGDSPGKRKTRNKKPKTIGLR